MSLVLLLSRYFVHSNLPLPLRLLSPCVTQRRHKNTRRPPKVAPKLSAEDEKREDYWGAILEYLDPPEIISKNRTKSAGSSHKRRIDIFDPITPEPSQPIKRDSQKQKRQRVKSSPISNLAFDIQPDGLFTNVLSKPYKETGDNYQAIIDTAIGTRDISDKSLPTEDISEVEIVAKEKEKVIEVSRQTESEIKVSETETEKMKTTTVIPESNIPETGTKMPETETEKIPEIGTEIIETGTATEISEIPETRTKTFETVAKMAETETEKSEIGTETLEIGTETIPEEEEPKFLEVLRESNWMKMGDPRKKCVRGIVINQTGKQVYVDYGHKFYGVFKIPDKMEPSQFQIGTKLLVTIRELELTQHFMGEDEMYSLLESRIEFVSLST